MTVTELIVETGLQVQRLNSFKRDSVGEQVILWRLNTAQDRLIKGWLKPDPNNPNKFQVDQKANTDIQKLITTNHSLTPVREASTRVSANLPSNFRYLVNDRSRIFENCKEGFDTAEDATVYPRTVTALRLVDSILTSANYYKLITIVIIKNGVSTTRILNTAGVPSKKEKFEIVDYVIHEVKSMGYELYWEEYDTCFKPESFIFVTPIDSSSYSISITIDSVALVPTPVALSTVLLYKSLTLNPELTSIVPNRGYRSDYVYDAKDHNYYDQPQPDSPVSQLANQKIYIHTSKRFLVSEILIDYIRSPRRISVYLNHTCELDSSVHEEVCSIAAEMILGNIEAPNYPLKVQENINRLEKT